MFPRESLLRLQRVFALELALIERGISRPIRFEHPERCLGAFGANARGETIELRLDLFSGDLFEIEHDPAAHPLDGANALPV